MFSIPNNLATSYEAYSIVTRFHPSPSPGNRGLNKAVTFCLVFGFSNVTNHNEFLLPFALNGLTDIGTPIYKVSSMAETTLIDDGYL
jgi:hypothetical protein